jgi:hypothetical protein
MKKKRSPLKDLLFISISSFIVAVAWVGFNIYNTWVTTTITPEMQITITTIDATFDTSTIKKLKARKQVVPEMTLSGKAVDQISPTPSPITVPDSLTPVPSDAQIEPAQTQLQAVQPQAALPTQAAQPQATISNIPVTVNGQ